MHVRYSICRFSLSGCLALSLGLFGGLFSPVAQAQSGQTFTLASGDVADFITDIQTLNANGGGTIVLAPGGTYVVSAPSDWWYGPNAFPAIASNITIVGNSATIERASGSPNFRFFYVSGGFSTLPAGSLSLSNLTLSNGLAQGGSGGAGQIGGGGGAGLGGAIYNQGVLSLSTVTFSSNAATGGSPGGFNNPPHYSGAGGGGGLGGNGGSSPQAYGSDGGGGGFQGAGGNGFEDQAASGSGGNFLANEGGAGCSTAGVSAFGGNGGNGGNQNI
jgi:hypothetical protein